MIFGKHINRSYWRFLLLLLSGLAALVVVDYLQLEIPELYQMVINGINTGSVTLDGTVHEFNLTFLVNKICMPMLGIILLIVLLLLAGFGFFVGEFVAQAGQWVIFPGSPHVYNAGNIGCGMVVDRDNILLLDTIFTLLFHENGFSRKQFSN